LVARAAGDSERVIVDVNVFEAPFMTEIKSPGSLATYTILVTELTAMDVASAVVPMSIHARAHVVPLLAWDGSTMVMTGRVGSVT
jgi:hypothetical protein